MAYSILTVRSAGAEDGRLYPVPGDAQSPVGLEQWDGAVQRLTGSALKVSELVAGGWKTVARFRKVKVDILITDSRFIVACSKYDKGGGWVGFGAGAIFALLANGVSKALAAHRRRGKLLVGQVRYAWLRCVGFKPKTGWASNEEVRLGVVVKTRDGATRELFLDVTLPKNVDAAEVARAVAQRAACYRLDHTTIENDADRARYRALTEVPRLAPPEPKKFALYQMPRYFFVSAGSAHPTVMSEPMDVTVP